MGVSMDASGLGSLVADLRRAAVEAPRKSRQAVEVSARKIKDDARERAAGALFTPHYPRSITYDVFGSGSGAFAEIGPYPGGPQWGLGNILEFGTPRNAPRPHLGPALEAEAPDFERVLGDIAKGVL